MIILSCDPGLKKSAYVVTDGKTVFHSSTLDQTPPTSKKAVKLTQDQRMKNIYDKIVNVCQEFKVDEIVSEKQFMQIMIVLDTVNRVAAFNQLLPFTSYVPTNWKKLLTGSGKADKEQTKQYLIDNYSNLYEQLSGKTEHEIDALGLAIVHLKKSGRI